jgi:hypothetical protein
MHVWRAVVGGELYDLPDYSIHAYGRLYAPGALLYSQ